MVVRFSPKSRSDSGIRVKTCGGDSCGREARQFAATKCRGKKGALPTGN